MPEISRFFGIVIAVFYNEHNPPHFHARYGEYKAAIDIRTLRILEGTLPPRALGLVVEWAAQHQDELVQDWELAEREQPPVQIEPLH
jgi:phosphomannomutase